MTVSASKGGYCKSMTATRQHDHDHDFITLCFIQRVNSLEILVAVSELLTSLHCVHLVVSRNSFCFVVRCVVLLCSYVKAGEEFGPKEGSPVEAAVTVGQVQVGRASSSTQQVSYKLEGSLEMEFELEILF